MPPIDYIEAHVRYLSADALDSIRPLARRCGFRPAMADVVRFAVEFVAALYGHADDNGCIPFLPDDFRWPRAMPKTRSGLDRMERRRRAEELRQRHQAALTPSQSPQEGDLGS